MSIAAAEKRKEVPDKTAPAGSRLIRRVRRLWQENRGVTLRDLRAAISDTRSLDTFHQALWGRRVGRPLSVAECETIIARIEAIRAAREGTK